MCVGRLAQVAWAKIALVPDTRYVQKPVTKNVQKRSLRRVRVIPKNKIPEQCF